VRSVQIGCYAGVPIGASHGVGPIGYLLLRGASDWSFPIGVGWFSVGVFGVCLLLPDSWRHGAMLLGSGLMFLSWVLFLASSEAWLFSMVFSLPYLLLTVVCVSRFT
jgi:hypothetical protein